MRALVIGGGVLGMSAAHHLVEKGADVTLVEREGPGSGTSSRGAGLVCEGMWHPTSLALARRSMQMLAEFEAPAAFHPVGSSTLLTEAQRRLAEPLVRLQRAGGAEVQALTPDEARRLPGHETLDLSGVDAVLHYPRDGWALPRLYCEVLALTHKFAEDLRVVRGAARLVEGGARVGDETIRADITLVAAGIWTRGILREAGLDAPLLAYRTQAARYHHPHAHETPMLHDAVQGFYLRPGTPGQLVAGDGTTTTPEDPQAFRKEADASFLESTARRVRARLPSFAAGRITDAWAGLDAATPDRLLLAGRHPDAANVWLLAGGNGFGFMRAPATGESVASMMLGEKPRVDLAAYDPARFAGRMSADFAIREGYSLAE